MTAEQRERIFQRARGCCEYCQCQQAFSSDDFAVEHIIPKSAGGSNDLGNLALSCQGCNNRKYIAVSATDPVSGEVVSLYNPRQHVWVEHFLWNDDRSLMIGISPTGRATIARLELNRPNVVNLRQVLFAAGLHPVNE